jgi:hypothetical protein
LPEASIVNLSESLLRTANKYYRCQLKPRSVDYYSPACRNHEAINAAGLQLQIFATSPFWPTAFCGWRIMNVESCSEATMLAEPNPSTKVLFIFCQLRITEVLIVAV